MAVTRLERKGRKNKAVAMKRTKTIQRLGAKPVIKKVDVEAIKAEFEAKGKKKAAPKKKKVEEKPAEVVEAKKVETPVEETIPAAKTKEEKKEE